LLLLSAILLSTGLLYGEDAVTPGELITEPPTLICLGFEWRLTGDQNGNASARVRCRQAGTQEWRDSLPLYRIGLGTVAHYGYGDWHSKNKKTYAIPNALCGSILDLKPATTYEVELTVVDPDGVDGEATRRLTLSTRAEPAVPETPTEVRHVYPPGYKGKKEEPAYLSIMHAVNGFNTWCDCYQTVHPEKAPPGTVIKLHGGLYKIDRFNYREPNQRWLHGTITLVADGTAEKPIYITAAGDGEVVIDGSDCDTLFNIMAADYLHFEDLTIRNTRIAFHGGLQGVLGCKGLTVKNCRIENVQYGVLAQDGRSENFYIADNRIIGANPGDRFNPQSGGAWGRTKAGYAVNLAGKGHVVCHNYAANFWDCINVFTNSLADPALKQQSRAIDIYNNDIFNASDNFLEADGGCCNIRVLRNRMFNCMGSPVSVQPIYAGPVYWIGNIIWNTAKGTSCIKPDGQAPVFIFMHNTASCHFISPNVGTFDIRNNLFMGPGKALDKQSAKTPLGRYAKRASPTHTADHNAYRIGKPLEQRYRVDKQDFVDLAALSAATGLEKHGLELPDYSIFKQAAKVNHAYNNRQPLLFPKDFDLTPAAGAAIIDAGAVVPGVNDGYIGRAPDIGAIESGRPAPHFGPRTPMPERKPLQEPENAQKQPLPPSPGEAVLRINCGCPVLYEDPAGNVWQPDQPYEVDTGWGYIGREGTSYDQNSRGVVSNTALTQVYRFENGQPRNYLFDVERGRYIVRMHFTERWRDRSFGVMINGRPVLTGFSIVKETGGLHRAVFRDFEIVADAGRIDIGFIGASLVNGIELFTTAESGD
jgi:hypothetical protein